MKKLKTIMTMLLVAVFVSTGLAFTNVKVKAASGQDIVSYAKKFLGTPYVWGGTTPSGFDCSGFVQYVYKNCAGISLPRTSQAQINVGTPVSRSQLQPGDLVFPSTGHVGIYVGNGQMIHSPQTGDVVKISSVYAFYAGRRISGVSNSYVKLDGGGYSNYNGQGAGINLIIRDFSSDVVRAFGWVDSDKGASWSFDVNPPNSNYSKLYKNCNKVITRRNGGSSFTAGATYKIKVKGYNKNYKVVCEKTINLKVPRR